MLPVLNFPRMVSPQVQDEIVVTVIYLEQRRREDAKAKGMKEPNAGKELGKAAIELGSAGLDAGWFGGGGDGGGGGGWGGDGGGGGGGGDGGGGGGAV